MSLKHAILGFLSYQPLNGYELKKVFDRSVRNFWPANQSQIYRTLAELREEGFVGQEVIEREDRLDMKIYHITPAGESELQRWLSAPLQRPDFRDAFLIQVYFGGKLSDAEVIPLLQREVHALEENQALLSGLYHLYQSQMADSERRRDLFYSMLPLEYGLSSNQSALDWLRSVLARLETGEYIPRDVRGLIP